MAYGELRLGKQKLPEAVICFIRDVEGDPTAGLLGMQFLRRFGAQIDLAHHRLVLNADAGVNQAPSP